MTDAKITSAIDARGVATVTLNNPDKYNAFDDVMIADLSAAFSALRDNPLLRVMILASAGKVFSAGADLNWMRRMATYSYAQNLADANALASLLHELDSLPCPTIARVQGNAFGGAVGLVACCDMAVVSERASFCLSEVKIGLIPATIGPYVIRAIGSRAARRYFTTAEAFSAATAQQLGLASVVTDNDRLDTEIEELVTALLGNGPAAVRAAKQLVADIGAAPVDADLIAELIADTSERIAAIRVSAEGQEGLGAFIEKRAPAWRTDRQ